jgi:hypothetical protein
MFISLEGSRATGFEKWPDARKPHSNDNDDPYHDNIGSMTDPDRDDTVTESSERPYQPWRVPGIGISL